MPSIHAVPLMQWEMYAAGTTLQFRGLRDDGGFGIEVSRDDMTVFVAGAESLDGVLHYSTELRDRLQLRGYAVRPLASRVAQLTAGPCWGPAAPLDSSLLGFSEVGRTGSCP